MKLHQALSVAGVGYDLVKADVRLELRTQARRRSLSRPSSR
ncbi:MULTISPECIES: hypothetical protein [unclassified Pseudomonas]|nr:MULTISPECIES: hypothetical protein [unclassified Pseudomonas]